MICAVSVSFADDADGLLTLTDTGHVAHGRAAAGVATVRSAVTAALPAENYATLLRLLADLVNGLDGTSKSSDEPLRNQDAWTAARSYRRGAKIALNSVRGGG